MKKRSVSIAGHATSITLEDAFWAALKKIADEKGMSIPMVIGEIDEARMEEPSPPNLSSAIRLYILADLQNKLND